MWKLNDVTQIEYRSGYSFFVAFVRYLERLGQDRQRHFSTYDFLVLDARCHDRPLSEAMRA